MAISAKVKPRTDTGAESEFDRLEVQTQRPMDSNYANAQGSSSAFVILILAVIALAGGYYLYTLYAPAPVVSMPITQSEPTTIEPPTITPVAPAAPDASTSVAPAPAAPTTLNPAVPPATTTP